MGLHADPRVHCIARSARTTSVLEFTRNHRPYRKALRRSRIGHGRGGSRRCGCLHGGRDSGTRSGKPPDNCLLWCLLQHHVVAQRCAEERELFWILTATCAVATGLSMRIIIYNKIKDYFTVKTKGCTTGTTWYRQLMHETSVCGERERAPTPQCRCIWGSCRPTRVLV